MKLLSIVFLLCVFKFLGFYILAKTVKTSSSNTNYLPNLKMFSKNVDAIRRNQFAFSVMLITLTNASAV